VLINRLLMAYGVAILNLDRDLKHLNDDVIWTQQFDRKSVEPIQKHVNKSEQRTIPEQNAIILLKLCHEWHTTKSFWARRNFRRGRWLQMAEILTLKIMRVSLEFIWRQSILIFSFLPLNLPYGAAVMVALQWFGLFPYIRYISLLLLWNFVLLFKLLYI